MSVHFTNMERWLKILKDAKKTAIIQDGTLKVHFQIDKATEMVEEYNPETKILTRRAFRRSTELKPRTDWEIEVGVADPQIQSNVEQLSIKENNTQPFVTRLNTKNNLEWRIRNLPYPIEVYSVTVDSEKKCIVVRTSNKKYFKTIYVPDLERIGLNPDRDQIQFTHNFNTLTITHNKPKKLIEFEKALWDEIKKVPVKKEDKMECNPS